MEKPKEEIINIEGIKTFIRIKGQGKTLLILHGWQASSDSWRKVQDILSENFKVIVLDLPGFGRSDFPPKVWGIDDYAKFVLKVLEKLNFEKIYLLGHSFGGGIAVKLGVISPDKIEKLILVDAAIIRKKKKFFKRIIKVFAKIVRLFSFLPGYKFFKKGFYRWILKKTDYVEARGIMKEIFKKVVLEDLKDLCSKIDVPTLIIWGKEDKITPLREGLLIHKLIPKSEIAIIDRAKHAPNLSHPEKLAQIIKERI